MPMDILVNVGKEQIRIAILEKKRLVELFITKKLSQRIVGNIYKGRVSNILPGMEVAFVDIGIGRDAFLPMSETLNDVVIQEEDAFIGKVKKAFRKIFKLQQTIKKGHEVLVQVSKEQIGKKGPRVTTNLTLTGRNLVFMPMVSTIGVSKRIFSTKERVRLRKIVQKLNDKKQGYIVRTLAEGKKQDDLIHEGDYLAHLYASIVEVSKTSKAPYLLYQEMDEVFKVIRDRFTTEDRLIIDSIDEYNKVHKFLASMYSFSHTQLKSKLKYYNNKEPLFSVYEIESQIDRALQRTIKLPSGGNITIDESEALTAIDVNTGKFIGKKSLQETVFITNMEAAEEIAYHIKLRNIAGIIIIDFISMESKKQQENLMSRLKEVFISDKIKTNIISLTELGLVQMTRHRTKPSLIKILCSQCPKCVGTGMVRK